MRRLPQRSKKYGVGKYIGGAVYVHRDYADSLPNDVLQLASLLPVGLRFVVIKYNEINGNVSFIESADFDTADEPEVGDVATVSPEGSVRLRKRLSDPYIYHHKWLFVSDDYVGFDVERSKLRSILWTAFPAIDRRRIGRKSYWEKEVVPLIAAANQERLS